MSNAAAGQAAEPAIEVFYSYASQDAALFRALEQHLKQLERQHLIKGWHRALLSGGKEEQKEIERHLNNAQLILLLISPDYLASDACYAEMERAAERMKAGEADVAPIILRYVEVDELPFDKTQLLPSGGKPVRDWSDRDHAFQDIVLGLRRILKQRKPVISPDESTPPNLLAWNIPYLRNPFFTGRADLLRQLHDNLTRDKSAALTQPQAIHGLGGIGKTQTAIEYAYRRQGEYRYILWINSATLDTLITSFIELAGLLRLPERDEKDQRIIIAAVLNWFATHNGWLAIFDNADDLALVEDYLPPGGRGHLLLTTRAQAPGDLAHGLEVEKMDAQEGMLLLLRRAKVLATEALLEQAAPADREAAAAVMSELDGLPLALDQAGAYIEETQCSIASYLEQYRQRHALLLQRRGGTGKQHPEPVATTWSLSFQRVEERDPIAAELLRFCAFLAPDAIPEQLIIGGASELGPNLTPLADDPSLLDEAIATLLRYSLVKRKREERTITVHRLVQNILRTSMDEPAQREWAERTIRAVNKAFPDVKDYRNWPLIRLFLPHAQFCAEMIDQLELVFNEAGRLCNQVGYYLVEHARYDEAEEFYNRAIAIGEKTLGPEDPKLATYLNNLALLYSNQGRYEQAETLFQRAITIDEKALGSEHPDLAIDLNNLANLYYSQGQYEQAEPLFQRALAISEKALGPEHLAVAIRLNNLANLYYSQGQYEQAEPLYQRALAIDEKALEPEHPDLATQLNNLANLYLAQGKYGQAEPLYLRAIAIDEKVFGPEHPQRILHRKNYENFLRRRD